MPIDPIIARAQQALAASLREAYYAGRGDAAVALKEKVLALVEELIAPPHFGEPETAHVAEPTPPHAPVADARADVSSEPHAAEAAGAAHSHETAASHESHAAEPAPEAQHAPENQEAQQRTG